MWLFLVWAEAMRAALEAAQLIWCGDGPRRLLSDPFIEGYLAAANATPDGDRLVLACPYHAGTEQHRVFLTGLVEHMLDQAGRTG